MAVEHKLPGQFFYHGVLYDGLSTSTGMLDGFRALTLAPQDTLVNTYSKTGSHWLKLMVDLIYSEGELFSDTPPLPMAAEFLQRGKSEEDVLQELREMASPRVLLTHMHFRFIEKQVFHDKVNVIVRCAIPKTRWSHTTTSTRRSEPWGTLLASGTSSSSSSNGRGFGGGDFFDFMTGWWNVRHLDNVFITSYEKMKRSREEVIRDLSEFVGKHLSEEAVQDIVQKTAFSTMKEIPNFSRLLRKGEIGDWKNYFNKAQEDYVDNLVREICEPTGLIFEE